jgi:hypothetical protein
VNARLGIGKTLKTDSLSQSTTFREPNAHEATRAGQFVPDASTGQCVPVYPPRVRVFAGDVPGGGVIAGIRGAVHTARDARAAPSSAAASDDDREHEQQHRRPERAGTGEESEEPFQGALVSITCSLGPPS